MSVTAKNTDRHDCLFNEPTNPVEESELGQRLHDDKEACEEDKSGPLHPREDVVHLKLVRQNLVRVELVEKCNGGPVYSSTKAQSLGSV